MSSGGRYLTSNVEIEIDGVMEVVGDRFTKFGTEQSVRFIARALSKLMKKGKERDGIRSYL
jgi:hypothetical protein